MSDHAAAPPVASLNLASPRAAIRHAVVARLALPVSTTPDGAPVYRTAAGPRVYGARLRPLEPRHLPAILVYAREEQIAPGTEGHAVTHVDAWKQRDLSLNVEIVLAKSEALDDEADRLTAQVEAALDDVTIPGRESATLLLAETAIGVNAKPEVPVAGAIMTWRLNYRTPWRAAPWGGLPPGRLTARLREADGSVTTETIAGDG